ncbi:GNAT family N-acetyltransferase [Sulfuricaulis sp.]|jgi:GNAT superfamily N-acetyltransferase|uniref:GNAT family N-acetyltransferase n=1 Tax=Sulfuricaulis sp. TaxID=2003553 RepID=UPI003559B951
MKIALAETEADIARCYPVMVELRPHLSATEFATRVRKQQTTGFRLAYLEEDGEIRAVAGFRYLETLAWGKILYVDDLVAAPAQRSRGHGGKLFDWLVAQAKQNNCDEFHLDSGVQRFGAHRFYLTRRMDIICHHFALKLK